MNADKFRAAAKRVFVIAALLISQVVSAQAPQCVNTDYDAVRDFSIGSNPNGIWSYGWESSLGGPFNLYTLTDTTSSSGMSVWYKSGDSFCSNNNCWPVVGHNDTTKPVCVSISTCVPPQYLFLHPSQIGELAVVRWTAPSAGRFLIAGQFMGIDFAGPTTTDVHVLLNSKNSLLNGPITSYNWPLTFKTIVRVAAGDTVDFAVGYGQDRDLNCDGTGVRFTVKRLGP